MRNSIKNKIFARICGHGRGWTFSAFDFQGDFKRYEIDATLSSLWKENKIRRICRGIYDYPVFSTILQRNAAPDINAAAAALARKFRWVIYPTGDTALNYFGISTQIPGRTIYLTDGPTRKFNLNCGILEFKHSAQREMVFKYPESALVVQGIRALGRERINPEIQKAFYQKFDGDFWQEIKTDTVAVSGWIYEIISDIAGGERTI